MKRQMQIIGTLLVIGLLCASIVAQSSGGDVTIKQSVIAGGGGTSSTGGTLTLNGTAGQAAAGTRQQGPTYKHTAGFWGQGAAAPTAATSSINGQMTAANGSPVSGTVISLNGAQSRKTITDSNGIYRFDNLESGGFCTITPARANYSFSPFNRSFSLVGNQTDAVFTGTLLGDNLNPLDTREYFVRQQYVDVLRREPDEAGFNYWSDQILVCGPDPLCVNARRREVAAAFFIEQEFQRSGSFIFNLYKSALGRRPFFTEYSADRLSVHGGADLETEKTAFARAFVERAEFRQKYASQTTAESFVEALVQQLQQSSGVNLSSERNMLLTRYSSGGNQTESRSFVVREVVENTVFKQAQYNAAFVLTEYFAYLRRDPEQSGYDFWLNVLNNREPGNYLGMVCSFISSAEYQQRFSSIVSHSNSECGQKYEIFDLQHRTSGTSNIL